MLAIIGAIRASDALEVAFTVPIVYDCRARLRAVPAQLCALAHVCDAALERTRAMIDAATRPRRVGEALKYGAVLALAGVQPISIDNGLEEGGVGALSPVVRDVGASRLVELVRG